jgi:hypothetical protein
MALFPPVYVGGRGDGLMTASSSLESFCINLFFLDYKKVEESLPYDYMGCQVAVEAKEKEERKRTKKEKLYKV